MSGGGARLFVYGSLRPGEANPAAARLHAHARHLGPATVRGRLYAVSWYPGLHLSDDAGDVVHGDLLELDAASEGALWAALDAYEGPAFARAAVTARTADGNFWSATTYVFAGAGEGLRRVHSGDWRARGVAETHGANPLASAPAER